MTIETARQQPPFADFMGMKITHVSPERVAGELHARHEFNNRHGIVHGGAIMAFADTVGAMGAMAAICSSGRTSTRVPAAQPTRRSKAPPGSNSARSRRLESGAVSQRDIT